MHTELPQIINWLLENGLVFDVSFVTDVMRFPEVFRTIPGLLFPVRGWTDETELLWTMAWDTPLIPFLPEDDTPGWRFTRGT